MQNGKIKTAVVLAESLKETYLERGKKAPRVEMDFYIYHSEKEIERVVSRIGNDVDAIIFSGPLPYERSKHLPQLENKLTYVLPYNGLGLFRVLLGLGKQNIEMDQISFDTIDEKVLHDIFADAGYREQFPQNVLVFDPKEDLDEVVDYHERLYHEGKTRFAICSISRCMEELKRRGVPCDVILPVGSVIAQTLEKLEVDYENKIRQGNIAAIINIEHRIQNEGASGEQKEIIRKQLNQAIARMTDELFGNYLNIGEGKNIIITNKRFVSEATREFNDVPSLLKDSQQIGGIRLDIGIGFGVAVNLAMENSLYALEQAKKEDTGSCLVLNEKCELIGPLRGGRTDKLTFRARDEKIELLAQETCSSVTTMSKIMEAVHCLGEEFTVRDLEVLVHVSRKSLERIIRQLYQKNVVQIVGQEARQDKGKPRRIYRLMEW